ncbi:MAG: type II toxin-antitoxin system PemK/MazF family toxin [Polyangia bacterium]
MVSRPESPDRGDAVWISMNPSAGHEHRGRRPALVLSPKAYNEKVGLAVICPITSKEKGYPFEVPIPSGLPVAGVVLSDQIKSLDWRESHAEIISELPGEVLEGVLARVEALLF